METEEGYNKKHVIANAHEGLKELERGLTVMFSTEDQLKASLNQDPNFFQRIRRFGASEINLGWIFTKNSPLVPLFKQATMKMIENGEFSRVQLKLKGADYISREITDEFEILSIEQLVLPFALFGLFLIVSFILLMIECCYKVNMIQGKSEEILAIQVQVSDPVQDIFVCGSCQEIYHDLMTFLSHKQNCQANAINVIKENIDT